MAHQTRNGFTLIELSVVLVIIALVIGGIMIAQDLIAAARVRSQISQLEKFNAATNTFRAKYGYLPGDMPDPTASSIGFIPRGNAIGQGDGDGVIMAAYGSVTNGSNWGIGWTASTCQSGGETAVFWVDLAQAQLIPGSFTTANSTVNNSNGVVSKFLPAAAMGRNNYVTIWDYNRINYYGISAVTSLCWPLATPDMTVSEASSMDSKIDDGMPQSGRVIAFYLNNSLATFALAWVSGGNVLGAGNCVAGQCFPDNLPGSGWSMPATAGSPITCYDNSSGGSGSPGVAGAAQHYSTEINSGTGLNCALSFRFQ